MERDSRKGKEKTRDGEDKQDRLYEERRRKFCTNPLIDWPQ